MVTPTLSDTARAMLEAAAQHNEQLTWPPERLPIAARRAVVQSMLKLGLVEEIAGLEGQPIWRTSEAGEQLALRATPAGLAAVAGLVAVAAAGGSTELCQPSGSLALISCNLVQSVTPRPNLRTTATELLSAWDKTANGPSWLAPHFDALRGILAKPTREPGPRQPRPETKRSTILTMLRRKEGATVALGLTRLCGHPERFRERCHYAENPSSIFTRVPPPDGGSGPCRA